MCVRRTRPSALDRDHDDQEDDDLLLDPELDELDHELDRLLGGLIEPHDHHYQD
jgi:hypothetical protein